MAKKKRTGQKCTAHTKDGSPCRRWAVPGRSVCKFHGGHSPQGRAHPRYKHGKFSSFLPAKLAKRFEAAYADPDLLSMRQGVALLAVKIQEGAKQLDSGGASILWKKLKEAWGNVRRSTDPAELKANMAEIDRIIESGFNHIVIWQDVVQSVKDHAFIASMEHRRLQELDNFVPIDQAMQLLITMYNTFMDFVTDRKVALKIGLELQKVLGDEADEIMGDRPLSDFEVEGEAGEAGDGPTGASESESDTKPPAGGVEQPGESDANTPPDYCI